MNILSSLRHFSRPSQLAGLLMLCAFAWSPGLSAKGNHADPQAHHEKMAVMLEMDAEQKAQFDALHQRMHPKMMAQKGVRMSLQQRFKNLDPSAANYAAALEKLAQDSAQAARTKVLLRGAMRKEMTAILRPEQREKWQQMQQKKHAKKARSNAQGSGEACAKKSAKKQTDAAKPGQRFFYK